MNRIRMLRLMWTDWWMSRLPRWIADRLSHGVLAQPQTLARHLADELHQARQDVAHLRGDVTQMRRLIPKIRAFAGRRFRKW